LAFGAEVFHLIFFWIDDMGVSKNWGTPKWMVKIMENPIKMDDLGGKPTIFGNTHMVSTAQILQVPTLMATDLIGLKLVRWCPNWISFSPPKIGEKWGPM